MRPTEGPKIVNDAIARASPAIDVGLLTTFACDGGFVVGRVGSSEKTMEVSAQPRAPRRLQDFSKRPPAGGVVYRNAPPTSDVVLDLDCADCDTQCLDEALQTRADLGWKQAAPPPPPRPEPVPSESGGG